VIFQCGFAHLRTAASTSRNCSEASRACEGFRSFGKTVAFGELVDEASDELHRAFERHGLQVGANSKFADG